MFLHAHTNRIKEHLIQNSQFSLSTNRKILLFSYQITLDRQKAVCDFSELHSCTERKMFEIKKTGRSTSNTFLLPPQGSRVRYYLSLVSTYLIAADSRELSVTVTWKMPSLLRAKSLLNFTGFWFLLSSAHFCWKVLSLYLL